MRPQLTELVWELLLRERAVNLYGAPFTGRARLLADLGKHRDATAYKIISIDIKSYLSTPYPSFLDDITQRLEIAHLVKPYTFQNIVLHGMAQHPKIMFLWHRFDAIFDPAPHHFPMEFFNDLNSLKNEPHFYSCYGTEKPHDQSRFKACDAQVSRMSWLQLFPRDTADDAISLAEVRAELIRRGYPKANREKMAMYIYNDAAPMQLFIAVENKKHLKLPFEALLKTIEQFRQTKYGKPKASFLTRVVGWMAWKK